MHNNKRIFLSSIVWGEEYIEYFQMSRNEFDSVIDKWANKALFNKVKGRWEATFKIT